MTTDAVPVCRFGDAPLTIEDVVALAQRQCEAALSDAPAFRAHIQRGADFLDRLLRETTQPVRLLAHSMGGLAVRAWLSRCPPGDAVEHVVTIGSPHGGTWLAKFGVTPNGLQMRRANDWLQELSDAEHRREPKQPYARFTCLFSHCDNIVFPPSTATLPGADNLHVPGCAHVHLAFQPEVFSEVWRRVSGASVPERALLARWAAGGFLR